MEERNPFLYGKVHGLVSLKTGESQSLPIVNLSTQVSTEKANRKELDYIDKSVIEKETKRSQSLPILPGIQIDPSSIEIHKENFVSPSEIAEASFGNLKEDLPQTIEQLKQAEQKIINSSGRKVKMGTGRKSKTDIFSQEQLKQICRTFELGISGTKEVLINRLLEKIAHSK